MRGWISAIFLKFSIDRAIVPTKDRENRAFLFRQLSNNPGHPVRIALDDTGKEVPATQAETALLC
jgi:hypothetical protein